MVFSDINSALHLYANPKIDLIVPETAKTDIAELKKNYSMAAGMFNVIPLPTGSNFNKDNQLTPVPEVFEHLRKIEADIIGRHPMVMAGTAVTNSGRQDDLMGKTIMHRYETIVENVETMFATAFEKSLEICKKLDYVPEGLTKEDLEKDFTVKVELRAEDSNAELQKATLGDRLYSNGTIDIQTLLTKYYGYTQAEAEEIQANMIVDKLMQSPEVLTVLGMKYAEESGMAKFIEQARQQKDMEAQQQKALSKAPTPNQQQRVQGETMTESGFDTIDMSLQNKGARMPPIPYTRGQ